MSRAQPVYTPDAWVLNDEGHKADIFPEDQPSDEACDWAFLRIMEDVEASLLGCSVEEYRQLTHYVRAGQSERLLGRLPDDEHADLLYVLVEQERADDQVTQWDDMWRMASPTQRRLLHSYLEQLRIGGTLREAAQAIGMNYGTAKAHLADLRSKLGSSPRNREGLAAMLYYGSRPAQIVLLMRKSISRACWRRQRSGADA